MEETNQTESFNNVASNNKSRNFLWIGIILILAILIVPKIFNSNKEVETTMTPEMTTTITPSTTATPVDVVNGAISVEAGSFYYKPNLIRVKKGEKVKLTLNSVSMMHDFNIDELGVKVPITKSGDSATVEFTPNMVGEFEFYCSVGEHRQMGQVGKLIVTE